MPAPAATRPRRSTARKIARLAVPVGLLVFTVLALGRVDFRHVGAQVAALPRATVFGAALLSLAQALAMATRLWSVFPRNTRPGWGLVARAFGFGQLANACLPGRAGDLIKVVAMARPDPSAAPPPRFRRARAEGGATEVADAMGVMLADKAVDVATLTMLVTVFAPALFAGVLAGAVHMTWIGALVAALAAGAAGALRVWKPAAFEKVRHACVVTWRTMRALMTPRRLCLALGLGVCAWLAEAASMQVLSAPFGVKLTIPQAMVGLLVLNVGIAVPVSVANVGAYEAATVVGLVPFGASAPQALAIGAIHHAVQVATIALFALAFWVRDRVLVASRASPALDTSAAGAEPDADGPVTPAAELRPPAAACEASVAE